ncbi:hypothetical protein REH65_31080 [Saccharopolyspora sp. ID03-671]|uniref:hypothetical protein n=1 Tax=Saccharopolyspora sp. ID03-671 TaxID=3073066 RepID=UPI003248606C
MPRSAAPSATRPGTAKTLAQVARDRASIVLFIVLAVAAIGIYATVLPSEAAHGSLSLHNWAYLDATTLGFSLILGIAAAALLTLQTYALRQATAHRRTAGGRTALSGAGFLASLVPSLCCTPLLPAVLALFGIGAGGATATMKTIAPHRDIILLAILALFVALGWWTTRRIATRAGATSSTAPDCCGPEH